MKRLLLALLVAVSPVVVFTGCIALPFIGPAISAYVAWDEGEAHAYYATDSYSAYRAVKRALGDLEYNITQDDKTDYRTYYLVADSNDRFKITVTQVEPYVTKVSIRINFMGDKPYAELIYKELEDELDIIDYTRKRFKPAFQDSP